MYGIVFGRGSSGHAPPFGRTAVSIAICASHLVERTSAITNWDILLCHYWIIYISNIPGKGTKRDAQDGR